MAKTVIYIRHCDLRQNERDLRGKDFDGYEDSVRYLKKRKEEIKWSALLSQFAAFNALGPCVAPQTVLQLPATDHQERKTGTINKDSIECIMEDLLDAHDFGGLRTLLHDLGYDVPVTFPNELDVPEEWALLEYDEHLDLLFGLPQPNNGQTQTEDDLRERAILYLEDGFRRHDTPFIRVALMALGFDIPFKEDMPSQIPHQPNGPNNP